MIKTFTGSANLSLIWWRGIRDDNVCHSEHIVFTFLTALIVDIPKHVDGHLTQNCHLECLYFILSCFFVGAHSE